MIEELCHVSSSNGPMALVLYATLMEEVFDLDEPQGISVTSLAKKWPWSKKRIKNSLDLLCRQKFIKKVKNGGGNVPPSYLFTERMFE